MIPGKRRPPACVVPGAVPCMVPCAVPSAVPCAVLSVVLLLAAACSSAPRDIIVVGSKNFTESILLGELLAQHIEARTPLAVERRFGLGGTFICHEALLAGDLDIYPEYTGTALTAILKQPVLSEPGRVFREVAAAYETQFAIQWMKPFGFNNTFAIVVRSEDAERDHLKTISDFARFAPERTIGFNFEFAERQDGYPGFAGAYGLRFSREPVTIDLGLVYRALRQGVIDVGVGNSTDGLISALQLTILEDDRHYFPPYDAAAIVRRDTLAQHPGLREALDELGGLFSEEEMQSVNYQIDGEHMAIPEVARRLRAAKGLNIP